MHNTNHAPRLLVALTIMCTSTVGTTWAMQAPPPFMPSTQDTSGAKATSGPKQDPPAFIPTKRGTRGAGTTAGTATATRSANTDKKDQTAGEGSTAKAQAPAAPSAAAFRVARWLRAIGGRISIGPLINQQTRVSLPNPAITGQGWRISTPSFEHDRMVKPPARATPAPTESKAETASVPEADE